MKLSFRPFCWQKYAKCYETPERLLGDYIVTVAYIIYLYDYLIICQSSWVSNIFGRDRKRMFKVWRRFVKWVSNAASRLIIEHYEQNAWKGWSIPVLCFHAGCTNSSTQKPLYIFLSLSLPLPAFLRVKKETCSLPGMNTVKAESNYAPWAPNVC